MSFKALLGIATAGLTLAVTAASAQTAVNGPYYATPSWDQTLPTASRYLVLANLNSDAVLDRETGLVWQRARSAASFSWDAAYDRCLNTKLGDRRGWRLPTAAEMLSLFGATTRAEPGLPAGHPFTGLTSTTDVLWTSTQDRRFSLPYHYQVVYLAGVFEPFANPTNDEFASHVLCVRSPGPLSNQPS